MRNEKLIEAREERGWTQEEAAEKIGVTRSAYARWEEKGIIPRLWAAHEASKAFNMSPEQLGFRKYPSKVKPNAALVSAPSPKVTVVPNISSTTLNLFHSGILALRLTQQQYGWTLEELLATTEQEMRRIDAMAEPDQTNKGLNRREILALLMSVPAAALGIEQFGEEISLLHDDEALSLCAVNVPLAWRLYFAGGLAEVKHMLPGYITRLSVLAQQPSRYQQQAACLASQAHQLGYLLALQDQDFSVAQSHAKQSLQYAELADDPNLRVASLVRQGNLFYTLKRPVQTMQKYQDAVQQSRGTSPLIVGQAYIGLAEAQARLAQKQDALRFQGLAHDTFPEQPENDLHFAYTHFNHFTRINFEGLMYLHLDQPKQAWESFAQIDKAIPTALVPQRVELLSRQALTSVALGDMEQSRKYIELAVTSALKLGSDLRYNEACETYEQMLMKWPHEQKVKELEDLFHQS